MTSKELVASVLGRMEQLDERVKVVFERFDDNRANLPTPPSNWSPFQILDHLMKANGPYIEQLPAIIAQAGGSEDAQAKFSWFGRFIARAAGPASHAPAPKPMIPDAGPMTRDKVAAYLAQTQRIRELLESAKGKDLGATRMNNPFVKITLADVFEVFAQHTERHVGQIEATLPKG